MMVLLLWWNKNEKFIPSVREVSFWNQLLNLLELICMCHLILKWMECDIQQRITNWHNEQTMHLFFHALFHSLDLHDLCGLIHCWNTPNRNGLQTNDTTIWIVTNVFLVTILFKLPPSTICVNTLVSKVVMATTF